tara:strand:+ start:231 stop:893 length:663 start_codon:yes stop_codon:yes gene_type:complete
MIKLMKKYLIASSLILGSFTTPLFAEESKSLYFSFGGGINFIGDIESAVGAIDGSYDTDNPFSYSFAIGKEFDDWRLEFNYSGLTVSSDSITVTAGGNGATAAVVPDYEADISSYMIYAYKDFPSDTKFTTYIGGGVGISSIDAPTQNITVGGANLVTQGAEEQVFTLGLKAGVDYEIAENTSLYSELGYINIFSFETDSGEEFDSINSYGVSAGIRFSF